MINVDARKCPQNHPCPLVRMCPNGAIKQKAFLAPTIDRAKCTSCELCVMNCGYNAFEVQ
jgi:Fe-S-cluster-containing hydrogenase component 2